MDFDIVFHALETVLTFFVIGCIGFILAKRGWFQVESQLMLSRLVTIVALPPLLLYNISSSFTRDELLHLLYGSLVPFTSISFTLCLGWLAARVFNVPHSRRGVFCASFSFSNTIYIGLPVNLALFGEGALPYVLLYYIGHTVLFWTVGNYAIAADGEKENEKLLSLGTLKKIFSPPLLGFFVGLALVLLDVRLPVFLANTAKYLGNLTTPLVIMSIGITLQGMGLSKIKLSRELLLIFLGRFVISPLVIIAIAWVVPLPDLMWRVFIVQSSLPVVSSMALLASYYKSDSEFAAVTVSSTTLLSLITVPLFMIIITYLTQ